MAKFRFTNNAVNDLTNIWDYMLEIWSEKQAEKYYKSIISTCAKIAEKPQIGKEYNEIYPELKGKKHLCTLFSIAKWKINPLRSSEFYTKKWILRIN